MTSQLTPPPPPSLGYAFPIHDLLQTRAVGGAHRMATRPWYRSKLFILPLGGIVLFVVIALAGSGGDGRASVAHRNMTTVRRTADAAPAATMGTTVHDGNFEFVVTRVQRPGNKVTDSYGTVETAQGEFVIVRVDVTNVGTEAQTLDSPSQVLFDDQGNTYESSTAIVALKGTSKIFLEMIKPGAQVVNAPLLFDVPPGTKIVGVELRGSVFSQGVRVKVS